MDLTDGRSEVLTRSMFTMLGSDLRPIVATTLGSVTHGVGILHQTVEEHRLSPEVIRLADQLVQGLI